MKNYKKGCILIIGQLRFHLLNKKFFENHKKDFDFFAVIDSSSEEKIKDLSFIKEFFISVKINASDLSLKIGSPDSRLVPFSSKMVWAISLI